MHELVLIARHLDAFPNDGKDSVTHAPSETQSNATTPG